MTEHIRGDQYTATIDGEGSAEQRQSMKSHFDSCSSCTNELERFQQIKVRYSHMPEKSAPPQLLARLRKLQEPKISWGEKLREWASPQALWRPVAAFTALAIVSTIFFFNKPSDEADFVDLDSLLVAHSKYQTESLVPHADISQSNYSARLAAFYRDEN